MQVNQEDRINPPQQRNPHSGKAWGALILVSLLATGGYYYFSLEPEAEPETHLADKTELELPEPAPATPLPVTQTDQEEVVQDTQSQAALEATLDSISATPISSQDPLLAADDTLNQQDQQTETPATPSLPSLNDSDPFAEQTTLELANGMNISPVLVNENILRRFVTFVDNMAQGELARKEAPLTGPEEKFSVSEVGQSTYINPDSYHRYDLYADFLISLETEQLVTAYQTLKPLLIEAFEELGYPDLNFDVRLQEAMNQALAAPVINTPIEIYTISVHYKFTDPALEALTPVQKQLIRTGPENTQKIKTALQRLQQALTQHQVNSQSVSQQVAN